MRTALTFVSSPNTKYYICNLSVFCYCDSCHAHHNRNSSDCIHLFNYLFIRPLVFSLFDPHIPCNFQAPEAPTAASTVTWAPSCDLCSLLNTTSIPSMKTEFTPSPTLEDKVSQDGDKVSRYNEKQRWRLQTPLHFFSKV